jgi:hypothetical protein
MKRVLGILAVSFLLAAGEAEAQSKIFERTVHLSSGGSLDLTSSKGSVRLTAWDRDEVEIHARIEADTHASSDYARRSVEATDIDVTTFGNRVTIRPNFANLPNTYWFFAGWAGTPNIHFEVRAPKRLDVRLNVDRSDTVLTGFEGRIVLETDRSEIQAAGITGSVRAKMDRSGNSRFSDIRGSIDVTADRTNLRIGFARIEAGSRIEIDRGDAEVSVSQGQGFELDTSLSKRADFDTNLPLPYGGRNRRVRGNPSGSVNGGGPRLQIEADRSNVRLRG